MSNANVTVELEERRLLPNWMHRLGDSFTNLADASFYATSAVKRTAHAIDRVVEASDEIATIHLSQHKARLLAQPMK